MIVKHIANSITASGVREETRIKETSGVNFSKEFNGEGYVVWCSYDNDNHVLYYGYKEKFDKVREEIENKIKNGDLFLDFTKYV